MRISIPFQISVNSDDYAGSEDTNSQPAKLQRRQSGRLRSRESINYVYNDQLVSNVKLQKQSKIPLVSEK